MEEREWITAEYAPYLRKRKQKHTRARFQRFLEKKFLEKGIDLRYPHSMPKVMNEMFWQCETLKNAICELMHILDTNRLADVLGRSHIIGQIKSLEEFSHAVKRILILDERAGNEEEIPGLHREEVREDGLAPSRKRAGVSNISSVRAARKTKKRKRGKR